MFAYASALWKSSTEAYQWVVGKAYSLVPDVYSLMDQAKPYAFNMAKGLTRVLAAQVAVNGSQTGHSAAESDNSLLAYRPHYRLRGSLLDKPISFLDQYNRSEEFGIAQKRSLITSNCVIGSSTIQSVTMPDNPSYFEASSFSIVFLSSNTWFDINYQLIDADSATLSYGASAGSSITLQYQYDRRDCIFLENVNTIRCVITCTPTYNKNIHYNGPIRIIITTRATAYSTNDICSLTNTLVYNGNNVFDPIAPDNPLSVMSVNVASTAQMQVPVSAFHNYDNVPIVYSMVLNGTNSLPGWSRFSSDGVGSFSPLSGNQGSYTFVITAMQANNASNSARSNLVVTVPNRAPYVAASLPFLTAGVGSTLTYSIPGNTFNDPDGSNDIRSISMLGMPNGMTYNASTRSIAYSVSKYSPGSVQAFVTAIDSAGEQAVAIFVISTFPTLTAMSVNRLTYIENQAILLPSYNISTPSNLAAIAYSVDGSSSPLQLVNASTINVQQTKTQLILTGSINQLNDAQVYFNPLPYTSGLQALTVSITDNDLNNPISFSTQLVGTAVFAPLAIGTRLANVNVLVGENVQVPIPSTAIVNHHDVPLIYSAYLKNDNPLPTWMSLEADSGTFSLNPKSGNQGSYATLIRVQNAANASDTVNLALTIIVPQHAPTVSNSIPSQTIGKGLGFSYSLPTNTFSDADGLDDIRNITALGLIADMRFNSTSQLLTYLPGPLAPSFVRVHFIATDSMGDHADAIMDINIQSSLGVLSPHWQSYIENRLTALLLPSIISPSQYNATVSIKCDPIAGSLAANRSINIASEYQAGLGRLSLSGLLSDLQRADLVIFNPATNNYNDVEFTFTVINDGLNQAANPITFIVNGIETYIPIAPGNSPLDVSVLPGDTVIIPIPAFTNLNKRPLNYQAAIYDAEGMLLTEDGGMDQWPLWVDQSLQQIRTTPPIGLIGDYLLKITAAGLDNHFLPIPNNTAMVSAKFTILSTLQILNLNDILVFSENAKGMNASKSLFQLDYRGSQNATVKLTMSNSVGSFTALSYAGLMPKVMVDSQYVSWQLSADKTSMNYFLAALPFALSDNFIGSGNLMTGFIDIGLETKALQITININPIHHAPTVGDVIPALSYTAGNSFSQSFSRSAFTQIHADSNTFTWNMSMGDGSALPGWLHFDNRILQGNIPEQVQGYYELKLSITDAANDPSIALTERQASQIVALTINPQPAWWENPQVKQTLSSAAGVIGFMASIFWFVIRPKALAMKRIHEGQREAKKIMDFLQTLHAAHPDIQPHDPLSMKSLLNEVLRLNDEGPRDAEAFAKLAQFKQLSTAFACANAMAARSDMIIPADEWQLLALVESNANSLKSSLLSKSNLKFIEFRINLIRSLLDILLLTDSFNKRPMFINKKLALTELLLDLDAAFKQRDEASQTKDKAQKTSCWPLRNSTIAVSDEDKLDKSDPNYLINRKIKFELKSSLAALSCLLDDDTWLKSFKEKRAPILPRLWYLNLMLVERLLPYAKVDSTALNKILEIYKTTDLISWQVLEAATGALTELMKSELHPAIKSQIQSHIQTRTSALLAAKQLTSISPSVSAKRKKGAEALANTRLAVVKRSSIASHPRTMVFMPQAIAGSQASGVSEPAAAGCGSAAVTPGRRMGLPIDMSGRSSVWVSNPLASKSEASDKPPVRHTVRPRESVILALTESVMPQSAPAEQAEKLQTFNNNSISKQLLSASAIGRKSRVSVAPSRLFMPQITGQTGKARVMELESDR